MTNFGCRSVRLGVAAGVFAMLWPAPQSAAGADEKKGGRIEGRVSAQIGGAALAGATVRLLKISGEGSFSPIPDPNASDYTARSGADGSYVFTDVEPGNYRIYADYPGYLRARSEVNLWAGQTVKGLELALLREGAITGRVKDESGEPVRDTMVYAMSLSYTEGHKILLPRAIVRTDVNGGFAIRSLPSGRYYVCAEQKFLPRVAGRSGPGQREVLESMLRRTYYPNVQLAGDAVPVYVTAGATREGIEIEMKRTKLFRVRGKVLWLDGQPGDQPLVLAMMPNTFDLLGVPSRRRARVSREGTFTFDEVPPGSYYIEPERIDLYSGKLGGRTEVEVSDEDLAGIELRVLPAPDLVGQVRIEGERPDQTATSAAVTAAAAGPESGGSLASKDQAKSPVPPPPGYKPPAAGNATPALDAEGPKTQPAAASSATQSPSEKAAATPEAAVTAAASAPAAPRLGEVGIRLVLLDSLSVNSPTAKTRPDGAFLLTSVPFGKYKVTTANLPEGTYVKSVLFNGQDVTAWGLNLVEGITGKLEIVLAKGAGEVSGTVKDADGKTVPSVYVSLWRIDGDRAERSEPVVVAVDRSGAFRIRRLAPGTYKVIAWENNRGLAETREFCRFFENSAATVKLAERGYGGVELRPVPESKMEQAGWRLP